MGLKHADARAKSIVESITTRLDPEHDPDDGDIEKENDVRNLAVGESDGNDGRAACDCPIGRDVEPLPPNHDPAEFAAVKMGHGIDVARVVNTALQRNGCFIA